MNQHQMLWKEKVRFVVISEIIDEVECKMWEEEKKFEFMEG